MLFAQKQPKLPLFSPILKSRRPDRITNPQSLVPQSLSPCFCIQLPPTSAYYPYQALIGLNLTPKNRLPPPPLPVNCTDYGAVKK